MRHLSHRLSVSPSALESRETPSASAFVSHGTLTVNGSDLADKIVVDDKGSSFQVTITSGGHKTTQAFAAKGIHDLVINGKGGNDIIIDNTHLTSRIDGGAGNDAIWGGYGIDHIDGGSGNDGIIGRGTSDYLDGGDGNDRLFAGSGKSTLIGGMGNDLLEGGMGDDYLDGGSGNDRIYSGRGHARIYGGTGNDLIYGHYTDQISGGGGKDSIRRS